MSVTSCFDRSSIYGEAEFLGNLDPNGDFPGEWYNVLRDRYCEKVDALITAYDPTLYWQPYTSEIFCTDETTADLAEFQEWWKSGADGAFESAWIDASEEVYDEMVADAQKKLDAAVALMDDEIREEIHATGEYDDDPVGFLREYCKLHEEKYGEAFCF